MRRATLLACAFVLVAIAVPSAFAQASAAPTIPQWQTAAGGKLEFDVASIRQSFPGGRTMPNFSNANNEAYISGSNDSYIADSNVVGFIEFAYKLALTHDQISAMFANLPAWVRQDTYVIHAKAEGNATKDQMRLMVQSLLTERFKLTLHFEKREEPVYGLELVQSGVLGPKLIPHDNGPVCKDVPDLPRISVGADGVFPPACDVLRTMSTPQHSFLTGGRNITMNLMADSFGASMGLMMAMLDVDRPVVNQTGLSGKYDFTLEWAPSDDMTYANGTTTLSTAGPQLREALKAQLGLKLEPMKAPIDLPVIDHVEKPSAN